MPLQYFYVLLSIVENKAEKACILVSAATEVGFHSNLKRLLSHEHAVSKINIKLNPLPVRRREAADCTFRARGAGHGKRARNVIGGRAGHAPA